MKWESLIDDEDIQTRCREFVRKQANESITAQSLGLWISMNLHQTVGLGIPVKIYESQSLRWLSRLENDFYE